MFAIYDIQGRRFRDTLEHLQKIRETQAGQGALLRRAHEDSVVQDYAERPASRRSVGVPVSRKAEQAYREMLCVTEREAILHAHQVMSHPVATVPITLDILPAWEELRERNYRQLPVLDAQQRIVGMVSERQLLRFLLIDEAQISYVQGKTVADAMSAEVITADPVTDVRRIARVMLTYQLSAVPIVDERDSLIGLVSRSDILQSVANDPPLSLWS